MWIDLLKCGLLAFDRFDSSAQGVLNVFAQQRHGFL